MPNSLRTSFLAAAYYNLMKRHLLPRLPAWGVTPDRLTWLGMLISIVVPLGFWVHPVWGFLLMLLSGAADSLDGLMARQQNSASLWGAFLDSSLDRVSDFFYLIGFWVMFWKNTAPVPATLAVFIVALLTMLISYTKARAEALGCSCPVGLMERGVRLVFLMLWALVLIMLPAGKVITLWMGVAFYGTLALATVFQRGIFIMRQMADRQTAP